MKSAASGHNTTQYKYPSHYITEGKNISSDFRAEDETQLLYYMTRKNVTYALEAVSIAKGAIDKRQVHSWFSDCS